MVFAAVFWNVRYYTQDQAINLIWVHIFFSAVPANSKLIVCGFVSFRGVERTIQRTNIASIVNLIIVGAVAVFKLSQEFKSVLLEARNGMIRPMVYLLAKSVMVILVMLAFAISALGIPGYGMLKFPAESFGSVLLLWATCLYSFECLAEALAVWIENRLIGMLIYMLWYFMFFLFGGMFVPVDDLYWPFKLFHYLVPSTYDWRGTTYELFIGAQWQPCEPTPGVSFQVCVNSTDGADVLDVLNNSLILVSSEDSVALDIFAIVIIAFFFKLLFVLGMLYKARAMFSTIQPGSRDDTTSESASDDGPSAKAFQEEVEC